MTKSGKHFQVCLFVVLAYMVHNSSILFLIAITFLFIKVRRWYSILVLGFFFIGKHIHIDQLVVLSKFFFEERFATYGTVCESSQNTSALIMQCILFFICFALKDQLGKSNGQNNFC